MNIEQEILNIKERNKKVELEKAWETSITRKVAILIITYLFAALVMLVINIEKPFVNAIILTLGYFLSFQGLPFIKKNWIRRFSR